jgi:hypothetical protein
LGFGKQCVGNTLTSINDEAAQPLLTSFGVDVSAPKGLLSWLKTNNAKHITNLHVFVNAHVEFDLMPSVAEKNYIHLVSSWQRLFSKLAREATNLQHLEVYWDWENAIHSGLGRDLCFVRTLAQLKAK